MKDLTTKEEYIRMRDNPQGGIEKWLPLEWLEDKIAGRPHKYPNWYLALAKPIHQLSGLTLKCLGLLKIMEKK